MTSNANHQTSNGNFKNLTEEQKRQWFEKKGIEYKPFRAFKDLTEDEKRQWFEKKGIPYVPKDEWIRQNNAKKLDKHRESLDKKFIKGGFQNMTDEQKSEWVENKEYTYANASMFGL